MGEEDSPVQSAQCMRIDLDHLLVRTRQQGTCASILHHAKCVSILRLHSYMEYLLFDLACERVRVLPSVCAAAVVRVGTQTTFNAILHSFQ